ncbi:MAG: hypothetical protein ACOYOV_06495 [Bacteroidales bacterium]
MGLSSEMKNLSADILSSFKNRIKENEELVDDVQKTLDGFRKDHQEMAAILSANAAALRKGLDKGEKERINTYKELMRGIHRTIVTIQKEVVDIQTSTLNMINEFIAERAEMAVELEKFFAEGRADRKQDEKIRMADFDALMKNINDDIKSINEEVADIFKETNEMLEKFEKEHMDMSAELRADLSKNLAERVEYTRNLLNGFQKRLSEISKENQKAAQKLRKDLDKGETVRLNDYHGLMKGIHQSIKGIQAEVKAIQKATANLMGDYAQDREGAADEWNKMQDAIVQLRKTGYVKPAKAEAKKVEKKEAAIEAVKEVQPKLEPTVISFPKETPAEIIPKIEPKIVLPMTLEEKVLDYISKHPKGVRISDMEIPLGETRMKLGFTAKALLDLGKIQKIDNFYFPKK